MASFGEPQAPRFDWNNQDDPAGKFRLFRQMCEIQFDGPKLSGKPKKQHASYVLSCLGMDALPIFNSFNLTTDGTILIPILAMKRRENQRNILKNTRKRGRCLEKSHMIQNIMNLLSIVSQIQAHRIWSLVRSKLSDRKVMRILYLNNNFWH